MKSVVIWKGQSKIRVHWKVNCVFRHGNVNSAEVEFTFIRQGLCNSSGQKSEERELLVTWW